MALHYLGWLKVGANGTGSADQMTLCNSTGLERQVKPIVSNGVWGPGWYNAADAVAYADNQDHFQGGINFDLQGNDTMWGIFGNWLVNHRVDPVSLEISPNGFLSYRYWQSPSDSRSGVWLNRADIRITAEGIIAVGGDGIALQRDEHTFNDNNYASTMSAGTSGAASIPAFTNALDNPVPQNRNPIPGWSALAQVTWPNAPTNWSTTNTFGMVLRETNFSVDNHATVITGCTGLPYPVAVVMGTIGVTGQIVMWRDGVILDPYGDRTHPATFTASAASMYIKMGIFPADPLSVSPINDSNASVYFHNILLNSDSYPIGGKNDPATRTFGFMALGNGPLPPCVVNTHL